MGVVKTGDRLVIVMTQRVTEELEELQRETELNRTDLVNRAISLYRFITRELGHGSDLLIRDPSGDVMKVHLQ